MTSSAQATITATWDFSKGGDLETTMLSFSGTSSDNTIPISGISLVLNANSKVIGYDINNRFYTYQGVTFRIPVVSTKDVITVNGYTSSGTPHYSISGSWYEDITKEYKVTSTDVINGYVEIVNGKDSYSFLKSIAVELAYMPVSTILYSWDWKNGNPSSITAATSEGKDASGSIMSDNGLALEYYAASAGSYVKLQYNASGYAQFNENTAIKIPVSSTSDILTVVSYPGQYNYTIGGIAATANTTIHTITDAEALAGYIEIVATAGAYLYSITLNKGNFTTATIGSTGWATFSNASATDFTNLAGVVDAYQVTGNTGSAITKATVTTVAANTGLLLNAAAGTYAVPLATTGTNLSATNKLVAVAASTAVNAAPTGYTNFVLVGGSGTASFKKITGDNSATVGAGKAYLQLAGSSFAPQLFFDGNVTGIGAVKSINKEDGAYYNLAGQRVAQPQKGLYIVNGKKVIIK